MLTVTVAACGTADTGMTQPTQSDIPPSSVVFFVHNTLNDPDNRSSLDVSRSWLGDYLPGFTSLRPWAYDDFASAAVATIRAVSWQGGYCLQKGPGLPPRDGPPRTVAKTFELWFVRDANGRPQEGAILQQLTLTSAEAHEQFAFDSVRNDADCAYYDYTVVLPRPFSAMAGTRYWLRIRADIGGALAPWGWRVGQQDNGVSASGTGNSGNIIVARDLAFSLSSQ